MTLTTTERGIVDQITDLVNREARLLDENKLDDWLALLTQDFQCLIPVGQSTQPAEDDLAIIREDRFRTEARVWRAQQTGMNHSQDPPSRIIRAVSNVEVEPAGADEALVHFVTVLYEWRPEGQRYGGPPHTIPMRCEYGVRREADGWKIAYRQLNLLQRDGSLPAMTFVL